MICSSLGTVVNLRVNSPLKIVRKTAVVLGIVCGVMSILGVVLRLYGVPGGSVLLILFTSLFSVVVMPLYLYALLKVETEKVIHFALRMCGFSIAVLQVGLLSYAQQWPKPYSFIYPGALGLLVAMIVFVLNAQKSGSPTRRFSAFAVLPIAVLGSLCVSCLVTDARVISSDVQTEFLTTEMKSYDLCEHRVDSIYAAFAADTLNQDQLVAAQQFKKQSADLIASIEEMKCAFLSSLNGDDVCLNADGTYRIERPADYDISTHLMVGADAAQPTGRGMELYAALLKYRNEVLHEKVTFEIPVRDDKVYKEQWVKDNFYHLTAVELVTRLTVIQKSICKSMEESFTKKLFRE